MEISRTDLEYLMENLDIDPDAAIRENYGWSGDRTCLGLVFEGAPHWEEFIIELAVYVSEGEADHDNHYDLNDVRKVVRKARKDSMGRGLIVFWPYGGLTLSD